MRFESVISSDVVMEQREARISTDAVMVPFTDDCASVGAHNSSRTKHRFRKGRGGLRQHMDDTHTGRDEQTATGDFLRVMRMLMFLSPHGGWSSREGPECVRPHRQAQKSKERCRGWRPRSELDISGHSFRKAIKAELTKIKPTEPARDGKAKRQLHRLRSLGDLPESTSCTVAERQAFWDDQSLYLNGEDSDESCVSTLPASPSSSQQRMVDRMGHRAVPSMPLHRNHYNAAWRQNLVGDDALRDAMHSMSLGEDEGSF